MSRTLYGELSGPLKKVAQLAFLASLLAMSLVVLVEGYELASASWVIRTSVGVWIVAVGVSALYQGLLIHRSVRRWEAVRGITTDIVLLFIVFGLAATGRRSQMALAVFVRQAIFVVRVLLSTERGDRTLVSLLSRPSKLLASSFLVTMTFLV